MKSSAASKWPQIALVSFLALAALTALVSYIFARSGASVDPTARPGSLTQQQAGEAPLQTLSPAGTDPVGRGIPLTPSPEVLPTPDPWDGVSRVTVLVMGLDYRDWEDQQGPPRTDTMMLLTIDPATLTAGMVSIPRDLYVDVPGFGENRINAAYRLGELYHMPGGGPGQAVRTVEAVLGVEVDYFAQVDFQAFEQFINELGGVQVDVSTEITVDPIGEGNTITLQPGVQTLDGPAALAYTRNRKTGGGDFDRAKRQQQVILGIRDRLLSLDTLPRLVMRAPQLYAQLQSGIRTNLTLEQVIQLAWLARQVPAENIRRGVIGPNQVQAARTEEDGEILVPIPEQIALLVNEVFATDIVTVNAEGEDLRQAALEEAPSIRLVDATGVEELGRETLTYLRNLGFKNVTYRQSEVVVSSTRIIDHTGTPYTVKYLLGVMNQDVSAVDRLYDPGSLAQIEIVLGSDWARENPLP